MKIEVDILAKLQKRVNINEEDETIIEIKSKWINSQYDHMPKYCKKCCLQGHHEATYWNIHPKIYDRARVKGRAKNMERKRKREGTKIGTSRR